MEQSQKKTIKLSNLEKSGALIHIDDVSFLPIIARSIYENKIKLLKQYGTKPKHSGIPFKISNFVVKH